LTSSAAQVLSEKVESLLHLRYDCLLWKKLKSSFSQKLLNEGLDLSFQ